MATLAIKGGRPVRTERFPAYRVIGAEEKNAVNRVLDSGILSRYLGAWHPDFYGGPEVQAFEREWADYFQVKHAIAVNSCTSGLQCAVGALGIGPGDEVIVSPYTMSASAVAPIIYGGVPVFADIEEEYFCLDPGSVEERISSRTKAVIVVDIFGQPYDAAKINALAKKHHLAVIEDCAQAPYAKYRGAFAGTLADIGVYSLNYHKHIHTGEGGVVVTNDGALAERVRLIRNHGESVVRGKGVEEIVNLVGFNFRFTEMQAAIGREQLKKLAGLVNERVRNCDYLAHQLTRIPGIAPAKIRSDATHAYYLQPFLFDAEQVGVERDVFIEAVKQELPPTELREGEGPLVGCGYVRPLNLLPLFQKQVAIGAKGFPFTATNRRAPLRYQQGSCPMAERMHGKQLFTHELMRPPMSRADLDDVAAAFQKVYDLRSTL